MAISALMILTAAYCGIDPAYWRRRAVVDLEVSETRVVGAKSGVWKSAYVLEIEGLEGF